jgi:hypothetical protein
VGLTPADLRIGPSSKGYKLAESSLIIAAAIFAFCLFVEFFFLTLGFSVMYKQVNSWQVIIHTLGVLCSIWMILDSWRYTTLYAIGFFCGIIPAIIEIGVTFDAVAHSKRESNY